MSSLKAVFKMSCKSHTGAGGAVHSGIKVNAKDTDADVTMTVLSHIISQLRPGADLSRVVLPTFILEPRSMLERITK